MLHFSIDIRTVILLVVFGNLVSVAVLAAYRRNNRERQSYRFFLSGKLLQSVAWGLLALRGEIPDILSAYLGNTLLFIGFALEAVAITTLDETSSSRTAKRLFAFLAVVGSIAFCLFANTPPLKVVVASVTTAALFSAAAVFLVRSGHVSPLRKMLSLLYGVFCITLFSRAIVALESSGTMGLLTPSFAQAITFLTLFLLMFIGTVGFILMLKEQDDHRLQAINKELISREALLKNILDTSSVSVFLVDHDGMIKLVNQRMSEMFSTTIENLVGSHYLDYVSPDDRDVAQKRIAALLNNTLPLLELEREYVRKDGTTFWGLLTCSRMYDAKSESYQLVAVIADITKRKLAEARIQEMAQHDVLTGLPNRALFSDRTQQALAIAHREKMRPALLFLDLDGFKLVNDTFGHAIGDLLLKEVANRVLRCVRQSDTVGRIGGDEFVILLMGMETERSALAVAEKIRGEIRSPYGIEGLRLSISSSIGISIYPDHGTTEIELARRADEAMYEAKRLGRDRICMAEPHAT